MRSVRQGDHALGQIIKIPYICPFSLCMILAGLTLLRTSSASLLCLRSKLTCTTDSPLKHCCPLWCLETSFPSQPCTWRRVRLLVALKPTRGRDILRRSLGVPWWRPKNGKFAGKPQKTAHRCLGHGASFHVPTKRSLSVPRMGGKGRRQEIQRLGVGDASSVVIILQVHCEVRVQFEWKWVLQRRLHTVQLRSAVPY